VARETGGLSASRIASCLLRDVDVVIVVTEWDEYRRQMAPELVSTLTEGRVVIDGRNFLDAAAWRAAGWTYYGMGRP